MLRIGEVEDASSIDDLVTSPSTTGRPIPDFENLDLKIARRTQENPNKKLQETLSPVPTETLNQRRDLRLLQT